MYLLLSGCGGVDSVHGANPAGNFDQMKRKISAPSVRVLQRILDGTNTLLKLSDGSSIKVRRFLPAGVGDELSRDVASTAVLAKADHEWVQVETIWSMTVPVQMAGSAVQTTFKEIETDVELALFDELKRFHYRGAGGSRKNGPAYCHDASVGSSPLLGFVEVSSSMIANTARKRFLDAPFNDGASVAWSSWIVKLPPPTPTLLPGYPGSSFIQSCEAWGYKVFHHCSSRVCFNPLALRRLPGSFS